MYDFTRIKRLLTRQKRDVEQGIKALEADDPVMSTSVAESSEPGTDSWMADVHGRAQALKHNLQTMLSGIKKSLQAIKKGNYGKCDNCGQMIEEKRLQAMPTATLCISCSKKTPRK